MRCSLTYNEYVKSYVKCFYFLVCIIIQIVYLSNVTIQNFATLWWMAQCWSCLTNINILHVSTVDDMKLTGTEMWIFLLCVKYITYWSTDIWREENHTVMSLKEIRCEGVNGLIHLWTGSSEHDHEQRWGIYSLAEWLSSSQLRLYSRKLILLMSRVDLVVRYKKLMNRNTVNSTHQQKVASYLKLLTSRIPYSRLCWSLTRNNSPCSSLVRNRNCICVEKRSGSKESAYLT